MSRLREAPVQARATVRSVKRPMGWLAAAMALGIAAAVALAFAPAFGAELLNFDDDTHLALNHGFRGLTPEHLRWMWTTAWMGHYQPLSWLSFALDHRVHGFTAPDHPEAGAFHATSVILHALTAVLVFLLARKLLLRAAVSPRARELAAGGAGIAAAGTAALLFALHPLRVESVVWLTERRDVLSAPLLVLALLAWLRFAERTPEPAGGAARGAGVALLSAGAAALALSSLRLPITGELGLARHGAAGIAAACGLLLVAGWMAARWERRRTAWYLAALLLLALSLLAKAWGMVLPALLLVLDLWPLRRAGRRPHGWPALGLLVVEKLPFVALAVVFARLAAWAQWTQGGTLKTLAEHGLWERAAQAFYGLAYYPLRTLAPVDLAPIYELPEVLSLAERRFLLPALAVSAVAVACVLLRRRIPALAAACAAFAVIIAPVLGFAQSGPQLVADRYSYLATIPFALLAGGALLALQARSPRWAVPLWVASAAIAFLLGVQTTRLARVWRSSATLWPYALALQPESATAALCMGQVLEDQALAAQGSERRELLELASALYAEGHARRPEPRFLLNLARIEEARAGFAPERREQHLAQAVRLARQAMELASERRVLSPIYRYNLGTYLFKVGAREEGLEHLLWFVETQPDDPRGRFNLAVALQRLDRPAEAVPHVEHLLTRAPRDADGWALLGQLREVLGDLPAARAAYAQALVLSPEHPLAGPRAAALGR